MSIFKRLFRDRDDASNNSVSVFKPQHATIKALGSNLQKRFSRGVQYNMKILIRGDRNVGKSALLNRLKGLDFVDQYIPTEEIEVACVHWTYKSTDDVVKVEVWDVVDKGRKKIISGLKLENNGTAQKDPTSLCLDAEFLDVYKGAHGVIIMLDMTKSWTLNYVERELAKLPEEMPVLVLANHIDMGHHRTVSSDQVMALIEPLPGYQKGLIKYWESSMQNGYGLVYIHKFFNVPFLLLQRDTLLRQLATNEGEMKLTLEDLEEYEESADQSYESFVTSLKTAKAAVSEPMTQMSKPSSLALHSSPCSQINSPSSPTTTTGTGTGTDPCPRAPIHPPQARPIPGMDKLGLYPLPVPINVVTNVNGTQSLTSSATKKEIFDFVPDEHPELSSFLDDPTSPRSTENIVIRHSSVSSSSDEGGPSEGHQNKRSNPMVAVVQDDDVDGVDESGDMRIETEVAIIASDTSSEDEHEHHGGRRMDKENGVSDLTSKTQDTVTDTPAYSHIVFDATDLDILEHISSRRDEPHIDQVTVDSATTENNNHKSKKHRHHHHKQSQSKEEDGTKKRKKKHQSRRKCDDEDEEGHGPVTDNGKHTKRHTQTTVTVCADPVVRSESSDSLEKFLNE